MKYACRLLKNFTYKIWERLTLIIPGYFQNNLSQFCYLEKGVLKLCRAAMIKPRKIERSVFFLLDHNGQTQDYRLVWVPTEVRFRRNCDFPTVVDNYAQNCLGSNIFCTPEFFGPQRLDFNTVKLLTYWIFLLGIKMETFTWKSSVALLSPACWYNVSCKIVAKELDKRWRWVVNKVGHT